MVRAPGDVPIGTVEAMTEAAHAVGILDRAGLARHLVERMRKADKMATAYRRRMRQVIKDGVVKLGADGPVEADSDSAAVKWAALAEQASGRGDKIARALFAIVADSERRAELDRREELAKAALGRPSGKAERASA